MKKYFFLIFLFFILFVGLCSAIHIKLDESYCLADVYTTSPFPQKNSVLSKWNITDIPKDVVIDSVDYCSYVIGVGGSPDKDSIVERITNRTWNETLSSGNYSTLEMDNRVTTEEWTSVTTNDLTCIKITKQINSSYQEGYNISSFEIHDLDDEVTSAQSVTNSTDGYIGDLTNNVYFRIAMREHAIYGVYLNVSYHSSIPNITLEKPSNNSHLLYSNNKFIFNFSVNDYWGIFNATLYHNVSGNWQINQTNTSIVNKGTIYNFTPINISRGNNVAGVYIWNVEVCNINKNCSFADNNFTFTVENTLPTFDHSLQQFKVSHNQNLSYDINCSDVDGDNITYFTNSSLFAIIPHNGSIVDNPDKTEVGDYFINITCDDVFGNTTLQMWYNITDSAPNTPTQTYPDNFETISTAYTTLNFTTTDTDGDWIKYYVYADQNANPITLVWSGYNASGTNMFFNYTGLGDGETHYWKVQADDNVTNSSNSTTRSFAVSTSSPAITIHYPTNNSWRTESTDFTINFTATDGGTIEACELWTNITGVWKKNVTHSSITSGVKTNFTILNFTDENMYLFSINCSDTAGATGFYPYGNITFGVDTIQPSLSASSPTNATYNTETVSLTISASDAFLENCFYRLFYNDTNTLKKSNNSINCSGTATLDTPYYSGGYFLNVSANDSAGNIYSV
ncbi:MAG: hypothetical protein KKB31_05495, partial [Nanoarchaeota archaeon]|nr:hypothetical protein [Nanoarchaeota archaeon]